MNKNLIIPKGEIADFCQRYHIRRLAIFGSALRANFGPESDVDVLGEFEAGQEPGFMALARMERELSEMFGRRVDLRTPEDLSRLFRDEVLSSAEVQYAQ